MLGTITALSIALAPDRSLTDGRGYALSICRTLATAAVACALDASKNAITFATALIVTCTDAASNSILTWRTLPGNSSVMKIIKGDGAAHNVLAYFLDAEQELYHTDVNVDDKGQDLYTWIAAMFEVLDNSFPKRSTNYASNSIIPDASNKNVGQDLYSSVPFSLTDLRIISDVLSFFSSVSGEQHLLLDTGALRSTCSEDRLRKASRVLLLQIQLPASIPPFCLIGHPVVVII